MNCTHCRHLLDAFHDGELDAATARDLESHLARCPACAGIHAQREALSTLVRAGTTPYKAPEGLRLRVQASIAHPTPALREPPSWAQAGTLAALAGALGMGLGVWIAIPRAVDTIGDEIVVAHVASLRAAPKVSQIESRDRHQIKPWFAGRVTFAPLVVDLTPEGFELVGARLDQVGDRQAAVVVYRIRNHFVNVLMWRAERGDPIGLRFRTLRGFATATWASGGVAYAAISDVDAADLQRLAQRLVVATEGPS